MRLLSLPAPLLAIALSALYSPSECLPLAADRQDRQLGRFHAIRPRASYSIVPIDGGSPTTAEQGSTTTVVQTVTSSPTATPEITVTATVPPKDTTKTVTQTDISVVPPESPTTVTATAPVTVVTTHTRTSEFCPARAHDEPCLEYRADYSECYTHHRPDVFDRLLDHILVKLSLDQQHLCLCFGFCAFSLLILLDIGNCRQHHLFRLRIATTLSNFERRVSPTICAHRPDPDAVNLCDEQLCDEQLGLDPNLIR